MLWLLSGGTRSVLGHAGSTGIQNSSTSVLKKVNQREFCFVVPPTALQTGNWHFGAATRTIASVIYDAWSGVVFLERKWTRITEGKFIFEVAQRQKNMRLRSYELVWKRPLPTLCIKDSTSGDNFFCATTDIHSGKNKHVFPQENRCLRRSMAENCKEKKLATTNQRSLMYLLTFN